VAQLLINLGAGLEPTAVVDPGEEAESLRRALDRTASELREQMVELDALRRARAVAESTNIVRGEILALVVRSMRTPADALLGLSGMLRTSSLFPAQRAYVEALQVAVEGLRGILNQVSDFSRLEGGTLPLEPIPFDLGLMLADLSKSLGTRANAKRIGLRVELPSGSRRVVGDPGRVRQIISAVVEYGLRRLDGGHILVESQPAGYGIPGGGVLVRIDDFGPPVPEDFLPTLFEPFGRGDVTMSAEDGLSLTIARQLARLMGGDLTVENVNGRGTRFTFRAPLAGLEAPDAASSHRAEALPTSAMPGSLLLVERDPALRNSWSAIAEAAGYRTTVVETRAEALAELGLRAGGVDVVMFSDHDAEGYDEIGRNIQRSGAGGPALIMLLAAGYPGDAKRLMEAGFRGYLVKPVPPTDLREALEILRRTPREKWDGLFITRHSLEEGRQ
jgi:signal transduction histidine kinase/CheY-like chemotaxis protein